jgi:hypothetical protein
MTNFTFSHAVAAYLTGENKAFTNIWIIHKMNQMRMTPNPEFPNGIVSIFAEGPLVSDCGPVAGLPNQPHVSDY